MLEERGNIWHKQGDAICIATNGFVKKNGNAVMGRGIAKEASIKFPDLPYYLGRRIDKQGNHLHVFWELDRHYDGEEGTEWSRDIVCFPVKHKWFEEADLELIKRSCKELMSWADQVATYWQRILLPRPGCGNGRLDWDCVREEIEPLLDDRVVVVTF